MKTVDDLATAIELAKAGEQTMLKCPNHDDDQASLHVAPGTTQPVVLMDHAGCSAADILSAAGLTMADIMSDEDEIEGIVKATEEWTPAGPASHRYRYTDEEGNLLFEVLRVPLPGNKKTFRQRHPDRSQRSGWKWNMDDVRRVLYRLPEVLAAKDEGRRIWLVEGEKDAEAFRHHGEVATTSPMGAGKWSEEYSQCLAGANVIVVADADKSGRAHARTARESLLMQGCNVSVMEAMEGAKDAAAHFEKGGTLEDFIETVPEDEDQTESYGSDLTIVIEREFPADTFVIPGVLAQGDRLLLTGLEGRGKSLWTRQVAVQVAAGIHPWTGMGMDPKKVIFIDGENHPYQVIQSWKDLVGLAARHDHPVQKGMLTLFEEWDNEIDLTSEEGAAWLMERVHAHRPDLIVIGPLYAMASRDLKEDETVRKLKRTINDARSISNSAIIMEHHAPHRSPQDRERSVRPYGSSMFLKWPDYGFGMKPTENEDIFEFQKTRFPRVRTRDFPEYFRQGKRNSLEWFWEPAFMSEDGTIY